MNKLKTPLLDSIQSKEENPLFSIARKKHNQLFLTWDYDFLHMIPANENTFILGFCQGITHATEIFTKQIEELKEKVKELTRIPAPTLERQDIEQ